MKLRLLISIFFIIATTLTAVHELEHTNGSSCQICIVDDHSVSADIIDDFKDVEFLKFDFIVPHNLTYTQQQKICFYQNRAPPLKS